MAIKTFYLKNLNKNVKIIGLHERFLKNLRKRVQKMKEEEKDDLLYSEFPDFPENDETEY